MGGGKPSSRRKGGGVWTKTRKPKHGNLRKNTMQVVVPKRTAISRKEKGERRGPVFGGGNRRLGMKGNQEPEEFKKHPREKEGKGIDYGRKKKPKGGGRPVKRKTQ